MPVHHKPPAFNYFFPEAASFKGIIHREHNPGNQEFQANFSVFSGDFDIKVPSSL
jgi:hypothetical protein